jgi:RimJ/RimL family protein N-acetyltransferase
MIISLKPITAEDLHLVRKWVIDPYYGEFFRRFPPMFVWDNDQTILNHFNTSYLVRQDDKVVGLCSLINIDNQARAIEYGVLLEKDSEETLKTLFESSDQLKEYVFNYLNFNKAYCRILSHRKDLVSLLQLNGLKFEAELKQSCYWQGRYWDELLYYQLRSDYVGEK